MAKIPILPLHPEGDDPEARLYRRCVEAGIGRLPDHVVARDLGVSPITVWQYRRRFGIPLSVDRRRGGKPVALPEAELLRRVRRAVHRGMTFSRIVVEVGTSPRRLRALVRAHGIAIPRRRRIDWKAADWSLPNQEVAEILGCNATTVIVKRLQLRRCGIPIPGTPRSQPGAAILTAERSRDFERDIRAMAARGMSRIAIARGLHVDYDLVGLLVRRCGIAIERRPQGVDWSRVDWTLPNAEIARRVEVTKERVSIKRSALRRRGSSSHPPPIPTWRGWRGLPCASARSPPPTSPRPRSRGSYGAASTGSAALRGRPASV